MIDKTGPKISSLAILIEFLTSVKTVGFIKYPFLKSSGLSGPPATNVAPSSIPLLIRL